MGVSQPTEQDIHKWKPPLQGVLKCNFDGAIFMQGGLIGYGTIIWDSYGAVVRAKNGCLQGPLEAFTIEALSCRETLMWLRENALLHKSFMVSLLLMAFVKIMTLYDLKFVTVIHHIIF